MRLPWAHGRPLTLLYLGWRPQNECEPARVNPHNIDPDAAARLLDQVGDPVWKDPVVRSYVTVGDRLAPQRLDDFAACDVRSEDELRELFVPRFWFGCEADDPGAAWASAAPYRLNAHVRERYRPF
jgi:hypothetical protein